MTQKHTSANTSINSTKVPAVFGKAKFRRGTVNLDFGGGKFDTATEYMRTKGVDNLIYDPYNRSEQHNSAVIARLAVKGADTCTISNVLNVIDTKDGRTEALRNAWGMMAKGATLYVTVYEGDRTGTGRETKKDCWQNNMKLNEYCPEVIEVFGNAHITNGMIQAVK